MQKILSTLLTNKTLYYFKINKDGNIIYTNNLLVETFNYNNTNIRNVPFDNIIINKQQESIKLLVVEVIKNIGKIYYHTCSLFNFKNKNEHTAISWRIVAVKSKCTQNIEICFIGINYNPQIDIEAYLIDKCKEEYFYYKMPQSILILNQQFEIAKLNEAFASFTNEHYDVLMGKNLFDVLHLSADNFKAAISQLNNETNTTTNFNYYDVVIKRNLTVTLVKCNNYWGLLFNENQAFLEQTLLVNKYERIINDIEINANLGWWEFNVAEKKWNGSNNTFDIFSLKGEDRNFRAFMKLLNAAQKRVFMAGIRENLKGHTTKGNFVITTIDGVRKTLRINGNAIIENNAVININGTIQDITETKYKERLLRNVLNKSFYDTIVIDVNYNIILCNSNAENGLLANFKNKDFIGKSFFGILDKQSEIEFKQLLNTLGEVESVTVEKELSINGNRFLYELNASIFKDVSNSLSAYVIKLRNIDAKKVTALKLEESEFNFSKAQKIAQITTFEYDFETEVFTFEKGLVKYFPYLKTNTLKFKLLNNFLTQKDIDNVRTSMDDIKTKNITNDIEVTLNVGDLKMNLFGKSFPVLDSNNKVYKARGILQNITERRKNEILLESILNSATYDIFVIDKQFNIIKFNEQYPDSILKKIPKPVKVGSNLLNIVSLKQQEFFKKSLTKVFTGATESFEIEVTTINNYTQYSRVHIFPIAEGNNSIEKIVVTVINYELQKRLQEKLINAEIRKEQNISQRIVESLEAERITLGSELHDNVNQLLGMSKLTIEHVLENEDAKSMLDTTKGYIIESINEIRRISYNLAPPNLEDIGLKASINVLLEKLDVADKFKVLFIYNIDDDVLTTNAQLGVYRIIQEAFNNIIKHSEAKNVNVEVIKVKQFVYLIIHDDGKGFDVTKASDGIGLKNIKFRARAINGDVNVKSALNKGVTIIVKITPN